MEKKVVLDTAAQVSILNDSQFERICPQDQIRNVTEVVDQELELKTTNGTTFPYKRWNNVIFTMAKCSTEKCIEVAMLVTDAELDIPII